jgi:hypothetical protein
MSVVQELIKLVVNKINQIFYKTFLKSNTASVKCLRGLVYMPVLVQKSISNMFYVMIGEK